MMKHYCQNDPCEAEAVYVIVKQGFYLCFTCAEAFRLGQVMPKAEVESLEQYQETAR